MAASFLRRVLALDAASCAVMGLGLAFGANALAPPFGLPASLLAGAGLVLLPLAGFIAWLATRRPPPALAVRAVILGNVAWTAESFFLLAQLSPTGLGTSFVAIQALAVLGLAGLEYLGLRRLRVAA